MRLDLTQHDPSSLSKSPGGKQSTSAIFGAQTLQGLFKLRIPGDGIYQLIWGNLLFSQIEHELGKRSLCVGAIQTNLSSVPTLQILSLRGSTLTVFNHTYSCQRQLQSYHIKIPVTTMDVQVSLQVTIVSEEIFEFRDFTFLEKQRLWENKSQCRPHPLLVSQPHLE